ncbi:MAG TPA: tetratricopeptide repeat protein [Candidatus Polarisedimenticolia bacterium]|jgi:tetratricopeptide (TPR) repeat protein|nr:tetratricopeptide repeat protein [Candidatus Polarisedimenticolia bacterium]
MPEFDFERLQRLPRRPKQVWQGGLVRLPAWVGGEDETGEGGAPFLPWVGAWMSVVTGLVHIGDEVPPAQRSPQQALLAFAAFAADTTTGGYLPGRVEVRGPGVAAALQTALGPLGIEVLERERLPVLEAALHDLVRHADDPEDVPHPLSPAGATLERFASFAEAARLFHAAMPWRHLTTDDLILIEAPPGPSEQRHALVTGRGGEPGLWLFESPGFLERFHAADDPGDVLHGEAHDAVLFSAITDMPIEDAALFEDHGFAVAGPQAYPWAVRHRTTGQLDRLSPRALAHVEAVLRALAATTEQEMDTGRWTRIVATPEGSVAVRLALPGLLDEHSRPVRPGFTDPRSSERTEIPSTASTPLERAQDICYEAFDSLGRRRVVLARRALQISPDCGDAWTILADHGGDAEQVLHRRREAVAAAERALGPERFASGAPFWGDVLTRPFTRALDGLAVACAERGLVDEAIGHYQRLLRLNPDDNQGVRHPLAGLLLATADHAALETLITTYDSDLETILRYAAALLRYRQEGDTEASRESLACARRANSDVTEILLGRIEPLPAVSYYIPGSLEEASYAVIEIGKPWRNTPGALDWLARTRPEAKARASRLPLERPTV